MKLSLFFFVATMFAIGLKVPQTARTQMTASTVIIRFLNGKNGKPIKGDRPNILLGDSINLGNPRTDSRGEIVVNVKDAQFRDLRVSPNIYKDCRIKPDNTLGYNVKYSLEEIITTGIVSANVCGAKRIDPVPGVLIVYVRRRTFIEGMAL
jgi:hypothetical protein